MSNHCQIIKDFNKKQIDFLKSTKTANSSCNFRVGDAIKVDYKIKEGANTRIQSFSGVVISVTKSLSSYSSTFTVRKMSDGIGVERKFTTHSPMIESVELFKRGVVRRSKLYYLRSLTGKAARIKEKLNSFSGDGKSQKA